MTALVRCLAEAEKAASIAGALIPSLPRAPRSRSADREAAMSERQEPSIEEMLADPIVRALMSADGVDPDELKARLNAIKQAVELRASQISDDV
jgi:hypothetical protein